MRILRLGSAALAFSAALVLAIQGEHGVEWIAVGLGWLILDRVSE